MKDFNEYIFESYLAESILYFSPKFRNQLSAMGDNKIAKNILDIEKTDIKQDITLIDIDKDDNYLSFIPMANAQKVIDEFHPGVSDGNISTNGNTEATDYLWRNRNVGGIAPVYSKGRNLIKIGKFVNKVLNNKYSNSEIEKFVNLFKATSPDKREIFDIVSGKDIEYWYDKKRYLRKSGTLWNSCMADKKGVFDLYTNNPETCKLLILKEDDKLLARALLWKINKITLPGGKIESDYFLDRVYSAEDYQVEKIRKYAEKNGWVIRGTNASWDYGEVKYNGRVYHDVKISVKVKPVEYKKYPYLDTLARYDSRKGLLHNDDIREKGGHILRSTWGEYTPSLSRHRVMINRFNDFIRGR